MTVLRRNTGSGASAQHLSEVRLVAAGSYLPERIVDNYQLAERLDTSAEWILERTGIGSRHVASAEQSTSDLGIAAGRRAIEAAGLAASQIDLVVCATSSPDWIQPATAAAIHGGLGMRGDAGSFDVNAVCT